MTQAIEINEKELSLEFAQAITAGYGHKKITVTLLYLNVSKDFTSTTSNMPAYDAATELEGEEKWMALYEIIASKIEDEVIEWVDSISK